MTTFRRATRKCCLGLLVAIACCAPLAPTSVADDEPPPPPVVEPNHGIIEDSVRTRAHETFVDPPGAAAEFGIIRNLLTGFNDWRDIMLAAPETTAAGSHPDASVTFRIRARAGVDENDIIPDTSRDFIVDSPPGLMGNPQAVPSCSMEVFMIGAIGRCSNLSQVGVAVHFIDSARPNGYLIRVPVFQIEPPADAPALYGFRSFADGMTVLMTPEVRSDGDYGLTVKVANAVKNLSVLGSTVTLWGSPLDPIHNPQRSQPGTLQFGAVPGQGDSHPAGDATPRWFLSLPTFCDSGELEARFHVRSWADPDTWHSASAMNPEPTGCEQLQFGGPKAPASASLQPSSRVAGSPAGLEVGLRLPFHDNPNIPARPTLRDVEVTLPEGVSLNPAAADGMAACSLEQMGFLGADFAAPNAIRFDRSAPRCPDGSKLATVEVITPLLDEPALGEMYLAEQDRNPFDSTFAIYMHAEVRGVRVKLAGRVEPDPVTGQVKTTFRDNPQLPFTDLRVRFKDGPRAALLTPRACGAYTSDSTLTPWSHPHSGPAVLAQDSFTVDRGIGGRDCASSQPARFAPQFAAGVADSLAGSFSPFAVTVARDDAMEELKEIRSVDLPKGLLANVSSVELCGEADADRGSCPEASRIGRVQVAAGTSSSVVWVPEAGKSPTSVSLTGPYRGAPYGLSVVVPAQAGPFDLGTVVVRVALHIDRRTAQVRARVHQTRIYDNDGSLDQVTEDAIPRILDGVVLHQKEIRVITDRESFMLTPTDCSQQQVGADLHGYDGGQAAVESRFQVAACAALPFKPRLTMRLTGRKQTRTGRHPGIRAQVTQTGVGEAGIGKAKVTLPKSLALDVNNAQALCEFEDGTKPDLENHCPAGSIVGRAVARTPLLKQPLQGNVYFVKNVRRDPRTGNAIRTLPMIIAALRGEVAINLVGESDTTKAGRLVSTFNEVPDAPVSKFNLNINGGKNGIIAVTRTRRALINLCARPKSHIADADMDGQNGKVYDRDVRMTTPCSKRQVNKAKRAQARKRNR